MLLVLNRAAGAPLARVPVAIRRAVTFVLVVVGWVLFRSTSFTMASVWLQRMAGLGPGSEAVPLVLVAWIVAGVIAVNLLPETWDIRFSRRPRWAVVYAMLFLAAYLAMNGRDTVFLYYQFGGCWITRPRGIPSAAARARPRCASISTSSPRRGSTGSGRIRTTTPKSCAWCGSSSRRASACWRSAPGRVICWRRSSHRAVWGST
jgi:hypothetical protein